MQWDTIRLNADEERGISLWSSVNGRLPHTVTGSSTPIAQATRLVTSIVWSSRALFACRAQIFVIAQHNDQFCNETACERARQELPGDRVDERKKSRQGRMLFMSNDRSGSTTDRRRFPRLTRMAAAVSGAASLARHSAAAGQELAKGTQAGGLRSGMIGYMLPHERCPLPELVKLGGLAARSDQPRVIEFHGQRVPPKIGRV
jgi:hypothetical protein